MRLQADERWVSFQLKGAAGDGRVDGSSVTYGQVLPGVELRYRSEPDELKEELVLADVDAPSEFVFDVQAADGLVPRVQDGGVVFEDLAGIGQVWFAPPFMVDAAGVSSQAARFEVLPVPGGWTVSLILDRGWLTAGERQFPVLVDPTATFNQPSSDCYLDEGSPTNANCHFDHLSVEGASDGPGDRERTLVRFDDVTTAVPRDAVVRDARLRLHAVTASAGPAEVAVHAVTTGWDTTSTWQQASTSTAWGNAGGDFDPAAAATTTVSTAGSTYAWYPTRLAEAWVNGSVDNHGMLVKLADESQLAEFQFGSLDHADSAKRPTLRIRYEPRAGQAKWYRTHDVALGDRLSAQVNMASANLLLQATDLQIPGTGMDLAVNRFYNSHRAPHSKELGHGWRLNVGVGVRLQQDVGSVLFHGPTGTIDRFDEDGAGGYSEPAGLDATLSFDSASNTFTLEYPKSKITETYTVFNSDGDARLTKRADRNGNEITYGYTCDACPLTSITDTRGRVVELRYDTNFNLSEIEDWAGRVHSYGYSAPNQFGTRTLTSHTDPAGKVTTYHYASNADLTKIVDAEGNTTVFGYHPWNHQLQSITRVNDNATGAGDTWGFARTAPTTTVDGKMVVTDPRGNDTTFEFDLDSRITKTIDANGNEQSNTYTSNHNVATYSDSLSFVSTLNYDTNDNLTSATRPSSGSGQNAAVSRWSYTGATHTFLPSSQTDPEGSCSSFVYDANGNRTDAYTGQTASGSPPNCDGGTSGDRWQSTYNSDGTLASVTDPAGTVTSYSYNPDGELTGIDHPAPLGDESFTYDALSRVATHTDGNLNVTGYTYDTADRVTKLTYGGDTLCTSAATCITYTYDATGNLTRRVDGTGPTSYTYDPQHRPTRISAYPAAVSPEAPAAYWRLGESSGTKANDAVGSRHGQYRGGYTLGQPGAIAGDANTAVAFDGSSGYVNVSDTLDQPGSFTVEAWVKPADEDSAGRIIAKDDLAVGWGLALSELGDRKVRFYQHLSVPASTTTSTAIPAGEWTHVVGVYDKSTGVRRIYLNGQLDVEITGITAAAVTDTDAPLRLAAAGPAAAPSLFLDGSLDEPAVYTGVALAPVAVHAHAQAGAIGTAMTYDPVGNLASLANLAGTVTYSHDKVNRLSTLAEPGGDCTASPAVLCTTFAYDDNNRRITTTYPTSPLVSEHATYDNAGNLTAIKASRSGTGVISDITYTYNDSADDKNLRRTMTRDGLTTTYTYDTRNQLTRAQQTAGGTQDWQYAYDSRGNRTSQIHNSVTTTYGYNNANQLTSVTGQAAAPTYDGNGNETRGHNGRTATYNPLDQTDTATSTGGTTIDMDYADGDSTLRLQAGETTYLYSPNGLTSERTTTTATHYIRDDTGTLLARTTNTGDRHYYLRDGLGSIIHLVDTSGAIAQTYTYDPYGNITNQTGTIDQPWRYAAGHHDPTGLTKFGTRYYDPTIGRWTQTDPSGIDQHYIYAGNDPCNYTDKTGLHRDEHPLCRTAHSWLKWVSYGGWARAAYWSFKGEPSKGGPETVKGFLSWAIGRAIGVHPAVAGLATYGDALCSLDTWARR